MSELHHRSDSPTENLLPCSSNPGCTTIARIFILWCFFFPSCLSSQCQLPTRPTFNIVFSLNGGNNLIPKLFRFPWLFWELLCSRHQLPPEIPFSIWQIPARVFWFLKLSPQAPRKLLLSLINHVAAVRLHFPQRAKITTAAWWKGLLLEEKNVPSTGSVIPLILYEA